MSRSTLIPLPCFVFFLCASGPSSGTHNEDRSKDKAPPEHPTYCVLFHTPGPSWKEGVSFQEQPRIMEHIQYMSQQFQEGLLVMGGPFLDNSGGMMICRTADTEKAKVIANADPGVKSGLLKVEVKLWMVPMSSVR